jgi:hypothetical protein
MKVHGIEVANVHYEQPGANLPKWVREAAASRGYGDSTQPLSLFIQDDDIAEAFACAAQGNGAACVMAQAGKRIGARAVYFYRTTAWVDFGKGPIVRFFTSKAIYNNVIAPFDKGDRQSIAPGIYHLTPPTKGRRIGCDRGRKKPGRDGAKTGERSIVAHTERVVMAAAAPK